MDFNPGCNKLWNYGNLIKKRFFVENNYYISSILMQLKKQPMSEENKNLGERQRRC